MLRRFIVVFMLLLFPLQWSVAQGHELADDAGLFAVAPSAEPAQVGEWLIHTDDPGGICQFHQLSQVSAAATAPSRSDLAPRDNESWKARPHPDSPGSQFPDEIDRPKWTGRPHPAAVS